MGSSASKTAKEAVKQYPTRAPPNTPASVQFKAPPPSFPKQSPPAAFTPPPAAAAHSTPAPPPPAGNPTADPSSVRPDHTLPGQGAVDTKTADIVRDGSDPDYLSKLSGMGQVPTEHLRREMQFNQPPASNMIQTLSSRSKETGIGVGPDRFTGRAEQLPRNRLESQQITELLQDRQWINSPKQAVALAEKYNVDVDVMETLGRFIGTYDRDPNTAVQMKEGHTLHLALWKDPILPRGRMKRREAIE